MVGLWTGATSTNKAKQLMTQLSPAGIKSKDLFCWIPALEGCKTRKCFANTTKPIWIKPISVLQRQILPKFKQVAYTHTHTHMRSLISLILCTQVILLDDNVEKMQGIFNSSTGKVRCGGVLYVCTHMPTPAHPPTHPHTCKQCNQAIV